MPPDIPLRPLRDREYLALTLYGECRGESLEGQLAVASVLMNRKRSGRWGPTYASVCLAPKQFSCWNIDSEALPLLRTIGNELVNGVVRDHALTTCLWLADGIIAEAFDSTIDTATHYYATSLTSAPSWATSGVFVAQVDHQRFFKNVA